MSLYVRVLPQRRSCQRGLERCDESVSWVHAPCSGGQRSRISGSLSSYSFQNLGRSTVPARTHNREHHAIDPNSSAGFSDGVWLLSWLTPHVCGLQAEHPLRAQSKFLRG